MKRPAVVVAIFIIAFAEAVLLISTWDYSVALGLENERLKAQLAPKNPGKEVYDAVICPINWRYSLQQRVDLRRRDGVIYESKWKGVCT